MPDRSTRIRDAFTAYNDGDLDAVTELFAVDAQWHGIEHSGYEGETPT